MQKISGAQILMECLLEQGVDTVFGYPGGQVLYIYDALFKYSDRIKHILTAHEQAAAHAADGYARATGGVGVCFATSGPGATNLVTGLATAYMDSIPVVAITGNVSTGLLGTDAFQEADIVGITLPITKHNFIVKDIERLAPTIRRAFTIAKSGRPGPVLIDIPKDIQLDFAQYQAQQPAAIKHKKAEQAQVDEAVRLISQAQKPFIIAGGGVVASGGSAELTALAKAADAPVTCTLMGLGTFPATDDMFTGMIGMHGSKASNIAANHADLIIAVGTRFNDRITGNVEKFAKGAQVLHIDIDPAEINKNIRAHYCVMGDVKEALGQILSRLSPCKHPDWRREVADIKSGYPVTYAQDAVLKPQQIIEHVYAATGGEAIVTTEVGQHQMWTAQYYKFDKPRRFITSGGFGTMGYGLGAAIGSQSARPDMRVVHIAGDGSIRMNMGEFGTVEHYGLPIITVIINNGTLGMVRQWQTMFFNQRYSSTNLDRGPDFIKLAEAFNIRAARVNTPAELDEALAMALAESKPMIIECMVGIDERVLPMVPPGQSIDKIITE